MKTGYNYNIIYYIHSCTLTYIIIGAIYNTFPGIMRSIQVAFVILYSCAPVIVYTAKLSLGFSQGWSPCRIYTCYSV